MSDTPLPSALGINGNNSKCSDNTEEANDDANNISSSYVEAANDETANKENMPRRGGRSKDNESDLEIYAKIDLKNIKSLNNYFPFQADKGTLKPPSSVVGISRNFRDCFKAIRQWRYLTHSQQQSRTKEYTELSKKEKNQFRKNVNFLVKNKSVSPVLATLDSTTQQNHSNIQPDNSSALSSSTNSSKKTSTTTATKKNRFLKAIGLASSKEERKRKHDGDDDEGKKKKKSTIVKRQIGRRPQFPYQAGDKTARN